MRRQSGPQDDETSLKQGPCVSSRKPIFGMHFFFWYAIPRMLNSGMQANIEQTRRTKRCGDVARVGKTGVACIIY